jgi:protein-S-isoprenylcysteine O-methyltransferase Ste14
VRARPATTLALAVGVNTASVALQGTLRPLERAFGRGAVVAHAALIVTGWICFLRSLRRVPRHLEPVPRGTSVAGIIAELIGIRLLWSGFRRLGLRALVNADLFGLGRRTRIRDPIYAGYALWLAGFAARSGRPGLLPVAGEMLVLLWVEARVEDWARHQNPARRRSGPPKQAMR